MTTKPDHAQIKKDFTQAVNMTPKELETWLESDDSKSVGWDGESNKTSTGGKESVGHQSGQHILSIKAKKANELTDEDYAHMQKVVGYVHRHLAQKPASDIEDSRWRYSLMNWGHDPLKKH